MPSLKDLAQLVALMKRDNAGLPVWTARFECEGPMPAAELIGSVAHSSSLTSARIDGDARLVLIDFRPELVVAVARLGLTLGAVYVRRGLGGMEQ